MSHFTVAVITDDENKLEEMLEPYNEELEVTPYINKAKAELIESAKEIRERCLRKSTTELDDWDKKYINAKTDEELYNAIKDEDTQYDENGNELSTYNPQSKWDYWVIGGRWNNELLVKDTAEDIIIGSPSLLDLGSVHRVAPKGYTWCEGARIKDIEFKKKIEFENSYNKAIRFWELYVEGQEPKNEEEKELIKYELYKKEYYIERYETKEKYAELESQFSPFAFLDKKGWHAQGQMGWFGIDNSTKDSEKLFIKKFQEEISKPENQDYYLIIVDCHI